MNSSPYRFMMYATEEELAFYPKDDLLQSGYSVWQSTHRGWLLKKAAPQPGYVSGPPPIEPASYEGELRRTPCVPADK